MTMKLSRTFVRPKISGGPFLGVGGGVASSSSEFLGFQILPQTLTRDIFIFLHFQVVFFLHIGVANNQVFLKYR